MVICEQEDFTILLLIMELNPDGFGPNSCGEIT